MPHARGKTLVGVAAVVAASSFAFLVFGPLADERALEMAGHFEGPTAVAAIAATGRGEPMPPNCWRGGAQPFHEAY